MPGFKFMCIPRRTVYSFEGDYYTFPDHDYEEVGETCEVMPPIFKASASAPRRISHFDVHELTDETNYPEHALNIIKQRKQEKATQTYITTERARYHIHQVREKYTTISKMQGEHDTHELWIDPKEDSESKISDYISREAQSEPKEMQSALKTTFMFFTCPKEEDKPVSASKIYEIFGGEKCEAAKTV